jgi:radical SAM superfamily enzyme YgiQ (UPF0313 family)
LNKSISYAINKLLKENKMEIQKDNRVIFRVIDPGFGKTNIFRFVASQTIALEPVMIATMAKRWLAWLDAEVVSENNCHQKRGAPLDQAGRLDHLALQQLRPAAIIGVSASITNAVPRALEIIKAYAAMPQAVRPKAIIVGGWHAGDDPKPFLRAGADAVIHGEGEPIIAPLIDALVHGQGLENISGISYWSNGQIKRNGIADSSYENCDPNQKGFLVVPQAEMAALPDPDFGLVRFAKIKVAPVFCGRGCSGRCKFCRVKGEARYLPPKRVVAQIQNVYSIGIRRIFVVDDRSEEKLDNFKAWLQLLIDWVQEYNIRNLDISTQNRLSLATHPEVLALMRKACINTVCIGFESPIKEELGAMAKPTKPEMMREWTKIWKSYGFFVHCMMFFGYPIEPGNPQPLNAAGQPMSAAERAEVFWEFIKAVGPTYLQLLIFSPIIGTYDHQWLKNAGRLLEGIPLELHDGLHVLFVPDAGITPAEIQQEAVNLSRKFYARKIWRFSWLALIWHSLRVGTITISMPFVWAAILPFQNFRPKLAWQWPKRNFRISIRHWGAQLIILKFLKSLADFKKMLGTLSKKGKAV